MGAAPRWFQLYWSTDEPLVDSLLARAAASGAEAIVVTLDTTMLGWRPQDLNLGSLPFSQGIGIAQYTSDPRFRELVARARGGRGRAAGRGARTTSRSRSARSARCCRSAASTPAVLRPTSARPSRARRSRPSSTSTPTPGSPGTHLATLRDRTGLPFLLKGILHPDDARAGASSAGVDGVVVSNHGGRQVDGAIASLDALPSVARGGRARPAGRSSTAASAPAPTSSRRSPSAPTPSPLGRPYIYGLALAGQDGVRDVLANIVAELDLTMGLSGVGSVAQIGPDLLRTAL